MVDALGQELKIGDYVTSVWENAEVKLFQVIDFKNNVRIDRRGRSGEGIGLRRLFTSVRYFNFQDQEYYNADIVYKRPEQITKIDQTLPLINDREMHITFQILKAGN